MSKGSTPRPIEVDQDKFEFNWNLIFKPQNPLDVLVETAPQNNEYDQPAE